jgi:hypothetical protein
MESVRRARVKKIVRRNSRCGLIIKEYLNVSPQSDIGIWPRFLVKVNRSASYIWYDRKVFVSCVIPMFPSCHFSLSNEAAARVVARPEYIIFLQIPDFAELEMACFLSMSLACDLATTNPSAVWDVAFQNEPRRICVIMRIMELLDQFMCLCNDIVIISRPNRAV